MERTPFNPEEAEWETKKVIDDYKFKLQKAEQDISTCQTNVSIWPLTLKKPWGGGGPSGKKHLKSPGSLGLTHNIGAIHTLDMLNVS